MVTWRELRHSSPSMTEVTSRELLMHCVPVYLAASRETCIASYLQQMLSGCTVSESCISWLCGSRHICHSQPTLQQPISAGTWPMASWLQQWCLRIPNPVKSSIPNTVTFQESKCVRGCSCARANVNCTGDPDKCSRVELVVDCSDSDWLRNMSTMNMLARYIIPHCAMCCNDVHKTNFQHACCLTWSSTTILPLFVLVILFYLVLKFCS